MYSSGEVHSTIQGSPEAATSFQPGMDTNRSERAHDQGEGHNNAVVARQTASAPDIDHGSDNKVAMASLKDGPVDGHEDDGASTLAQSTIDGYTPSQLSGRRPLISTGYRPSDEHHLRKTTGRKAYLGACKALDLVIPIDYNEDLISMHDSSFAKLARTLKKHDGPTT
jgi:hypothetical protein